jgi:hypothetical protein
MGTVNGERRVKGTGGSMMIKGKRLGGRTLGFLLLILSNTHVLGFLP